MDNNDFFYHLSFLQYTLGFNDSEKHWSTELRKDASLFDKMPEHFKRNEIFVFLAASHNGLILEYTTPATRNNCMIVDIAARNTPRALAFIGDELIRDRKFFKELLTAKIDAFPYAHESLRNNIEFVTGAIDLCGDVHYDMLEYAGPDVRANRSVLLYAITKNPDCLGYAHSDFLSDRGIFKVALHIDGNAITFASDELRSDPEMALRAVRQSGDAIISIKVFTAKIVVAAMETYPDALRDVPSEFTDDASFMQACWEEANCPDLTADSPFVRYSNTTLNVNALDHINLGEVDSMLSSGNTLDNTELDDMESDFDLGFIQ
jgi:hypothetical protein